MARLQTWESFPGWCCSGGTGRAAESGGTAAERSSTSGLSSPLPTVDQQLTMWESFKVIFSYNINRFRCEWENMKLWRRTNVTYLIRLMNHVATTTVYQKDNVKGLILDFVNLKIQKLIVWKNGMERIFALMITRWINTCNKSSTDEYLQDIEVDKRITHPAYTTTRYSYLFKTHFNYSWP